MAAFLPALKIALPYITQIVTAAVPMFTSKQGGPKSDDLVPKQIQELQSAVTHNAESVKALAIQLKEAIETIDGAAAAMHREIRMLRSLVYVSSGMALLSIVLAILALSGR